ncbi:endolytic transglycosylase MltG [bacterium]|nr:endolytic transglycosylase MltG [bacterium]
MKKLIIFIFVAALFTTLAVVFTIYSRYENFKKTPVAINNVTLMIEKGSSWQKAAKNLKDAGIITDEKKFIWMIKEKNLGKGLKTGEFEFNGSMTPLDVANKIISGKVKLYSFTIPEGYNKFDAAEVFRKQEWIADNDRFLKICDDKSFLDSIGHGDKKSCEGLLFPSTYSFPRGVGLKAVMTKMAEQLKNLLDRYADDLKKSGLGTYDFLKLASIVEKETGNKAEQPQIASVFINRRKIGMKMQTDPSVIYGLLPKFSGNITKKDLMTDHPWNTYTRQGFPATPLCFPGESAIRSVLYPDTTSYLYFVATGHGNHYFSKSLKEHNAAVEHYQIKGRRDKFVY